MVHQKRAWTGTIICFLTSCSAPRVDPVPPPKAEIPPAASRPTGTAQRSTGPPETMRQQVVDTIHGQQVHDPYRWLERADDPRTQKWLSAQNGYTRQHLDRLPGRDLLAARLRELSYIDRVDPPIRRGKRYFFSRQHADKEKTVWYWRQGERGEPRVLIDPNTLSEDGSISLRGLSISWDGEKVAYKLSENAADTATLYVMDVASGKISDVDTIRGAKYAHASWTPNTDGFYYTRLPTGASIPTSELPGHAAVYFHRLGTKPKTDRLVHPKTGDPRMFISADLSRSGRFLFLYLMHGWARTDVYYQDLKWPTPRKFKPFAVGLKARFDIYAWKGRFYVRTDLDAPRYHLYRVHPRRIQRSAWQEIVPEHPEAVLKGFSVVGNHLALLYMHRATTQLKIASLRGKILRQVAFPEIGSASDLTGNPEDDTAYYSFSSYTTPSTVYRTSVRRGGRSIYSQVKVPLDASPYLVEQVFYPSKDGTRVSMFIVRRRDMPMDGSTPFLIYAYGGFNVSITPYFKALYIVWLEQGGGVAIPNLRGGGEYGENWHEAGMLTRKQNSFDDFLAAAEFLVSKGYASPSKLAIRGGSNGGLLVGAAMTQRPDLFRAVACHVPLLDMVRYHLFGSGKTWISEYGSAEDPEQFRAIFAYSPYHRVRPQTPYPALLMFTADSDDRVDPMHARKFTALIQHASSSQHPVLLRMETKAGHGGGDLVKKQVAVGTDELAFLLDEVGIKVGGQ